MAEVMIFPNLEEFVPNFVDMITLALSFLDHEHLEEILIRFNNCHELPLTC